jgi:hypothetical protein
LRIFKLHVRPAQKSEGASETTPFYIFLFDALQYETSLEALLIGVCPETQLRGDEMGSDLPNPTPPF